MLNVKYAIPMKGIVLAGGTGSRLWPSTISVSKQLLPVYDKPMIYYSLSTLMLAGINDILLITTPLDRVAFQKLLGDGSNFGINLSFEVQERPEGLAQALIIGKKFIGNSKVALILGDNIFNGPGLGRELKKFTDPSGAIILGCKVAFPEQYGIVEINSQGDVISIEEKPKTPKSNIAIAGLYFFDSSVSDKAEKITKSARGEFEITSLLDSYLLEKSLALRTLPRGTVWMDCGTVSALNDASSYVRVLEERQGLKIGSVEEIAWRNEWITTRQLKKIANSYGNNEYGNYLRQLSDSEGV